eukprot:scaffold64660_cov67-Phaeocystis_antarctica.AAC.4
MGSPWDLHVHATSSHARPRARPRAWHIQPWKGAPPCARWGTARRAVIWPSSSWRCRCSPSVSSGSYPCRRSACRVQSKWKCSEGVFGGASERRLRGCAARPAVAMVWSPEGSRAWWQPASSHGRRDLLGRCDECGHAAAA